MSHSISIAYVIDPRFPGGTSSAVASELRTIAGLGRVTVHAISSKMFRDRSVSVQIRQAVRDLDLRMVWDAPEIRADIVLLHNPSFLKFENALQSRIVTRQLIVVAHENFYRAADKESFDVAHCLDLIDANSLALRKTIAPISPHNRGTIEAWLSANTTRSNWRVLDQDWFNICDFTYAAPTPDPQDRRGRLSRPGMEKFPPLADLKLCFPEHAQANVILGADHLGMAKSLPPYWTLFQFQGLEVATFFEMIDFMVYFTAPTWRESFGRVLAEAIAAGKVVISDPGTAAAFKGGVIGATPKDVDKIIAEFLKSPSAYQDHVSMAQDKLKSYAPDRFRALFQGILHSQPGVAA